MRIALFFRGDLKGVVQPKMVRLSPRRLPGICLIEEQTLEELFTLLALVKLLLE
jgi:hypothetical protein